MKQFVLWMAVIGLATTGCAQNRVFGPHARRGGADFQMARSQSTPRPNSSPNFRTAMPNFRTAMNGTEESQDDIELAAYGARCRGGNGQCCGDCAVDGSCGCPDECCGGGDGGYADDCCGDDGCRLGGGRLGGGRLGGGRLAGQLGGGDGCSSCGGRGCGLCQRMVGRVASGFCPHGGGYPAAYNYNPSPPSGQVTYPYYTVRGPRDFLRNNPPSIGPY